MTIIHEQKLKTNKIYQNRADSHETVPFQYYQQMDQ